MGKVTIIKKSRKECRCSKCGQVIPVGSQYYRGTLNFNPDIIRCNSCKLESWEVTTSDYQINVGNIVYRWYESFGSGESAPEEISSELESIRDELQDRLDNMPEGLQDADTGMILQERIENSEDAMNELDNIDTDSLKQEVVDEYNQELEDSDKEVEELDWDNPEQYADVMDITEALETKISEAIDEALSVIEI